MQMNRLAAVVTALAGFLCQAHAKTISLNFDSLPSAQGWTYGHAEVEGGPVNNVPEASIFSVNGGVLTQNALGEAPGYFIYTLTDAIDTTLPFTISIRARVIEEGGDLSRDLGAFSVSALAGTEVFDITLRPHVIQDGWASKLSTTIDNTQFHDYRLEATPGIGYKVFVDNVLLATGTPTPLANIGSIRPFVNELSLGDGTFVVSTHAEVTSYIFTQVPEPTTALLLGSGLAGLALWRRRRQNA